VELRDGDSIIVGRATNKDIFPIFDINTEAQQTEKKYFVPSSVSREHVKITNHNGRCVVEDLNSENGTFVKFKIDPELPEFKF
jgi:pSer/pThr/pTyr-binding forkhead associated (FHA) protein